MPSRRVLQVAAGASAGLLVALLLLRPSGVGWDAPSAPGASTAPGPLFEEPLPAPRLALVSHRGDSVRLEDFRGRAVAVFFGYTHCPDVCPLTIAHLSRALRELGPRADELQVLFVSVDPARDTPEVLSRWLEGFHPSILGLTGDEADVDRQAFDFGVAVHRGEGEDYLVDHGARTFLLDAEGRLAGSISAGAGAAEVEAGVDAILARVR